MKRENKYNGLWVMLMLFSFLFAGCGSISKPDTFNSDTIMDGSALIEQGLKYKYNKAFTVVEAREHGGTSIRDMSRGCEATVADENGVEFQAYLGSPSDKVKDNYIGCLREGEFLTAVEEILRKGSFYTIEGLYGVFPVMEDAMEENCSLSQYLNNSKSYFGGTIVLKGQADREQMSIFKDILNELVENGYYYSMTIRVDTAEQGIMQRPGEKMPENELIARVLGVNEG